MVVPCFFLWYGLVLVIGRRRNVASKQENGARLMHLLFFTFLGWGVGLPAFRLSVLWFCLYTHVYSIRRRLTD